jgi:hypothetical protein
VIGQIESVERGSGEFGAIVIRPAVDFSSIEAVLVVTTPPLTGAEDAAAAGTGAAAGPALQAHE